MSSSRRSLRVGNHLALVCAVIIGFTFVQVFPTLREATVKSIDEHVRVVDESHDDRFADNHAALRKVLLDMREKVSAYSATDFVSWVRRSDDLAGIKRVLKDRVVEDSEWASVAGQSGDSAEANKDFDRYRLPPEQIYRDVTETGTVKCPEGLTLVDLGPPNGNKVHCEKDGIKAGPAVTFAYQKHRRQIASTYNFKDGELHGKLILWGRDGKPSGMYEYESGKEIRSERH